MSQPLSTKGYDFGRLSYETIGACIEVQRQLGVHCMEVDYQRALKLALPKRGLQFQREVEIPISFDGVVITKRRVDDDGSSREYLPRLWATHASQ